MKWSQWSQSQSGCDSDLEVNLRVPNPVEPDRPIELRARVLRRDDGQYVGWVDLNVNGADLELLCVNSPDEHVARQTIEEGLRAMFGSIVDAIK